MKEQSTQPSKPSALIVDDDPDIREILDDLLQSEGYDTQSVGTASGGIAQVKQRPFRSVILNNSMPGGQGISFIKVFQEVAPALPIIMLTGQSGEQIMEEALRLGACAFLVKPYERADLLQTVARAVKGS